MTVAIVALGTAISIATDMTDGIIARFRTMDIAKVSVLTGHVLAALIKTGFAVVIVPGVRVPARLPFRRRRRRLARRDRRCSSSSRSRSPG